MPQLDHVTYFSQVFWLIVVFLAIYLVVSFRYIPRLAFILKYRTKINYLKGRYFEMAGTEYNYHTTRFGIVKRHLTQVTRLSNVLTTHYQNWYITAEKDLNQIQMASGKAALITSHAMFPAYNHMKSTYLN